MVIEIRAIFTDKGLCTSGKGHERTFQGDGNDWPGGQNSTSSTLKICAFYYT